MPIEDGLALLRKAKEKETERLLWERWLVEFGRMDKDTFIGFNDYKDKMMAPKISQKPAEEILAMVKDIRSKLESSNEGG